MVKFNWSKIKIYKLKNLINKVKLNLYVILYFYFIRYFADQQGVKINTNINTESKVIEDDLFGVKQIQIFYITSQSKLKKALEMGDKKIVFTDYKNYKKGA